MATEASSPLPPFDGVEDLALHSPQPFSSHSTTKDVLSSPPAPPLIHPQPALSPSHDYNFSSIVYDESSAPPTDHEDAYATTDDDLGRLAPGAETTSSRSSISSLPASVTASAMVPPRDKLVTPTRSPSGFGHMRSGSGLRSLSRRNGALQDEGRDMTPFRHPSSVRAMQMRDEFEDNYDLTPGHRYRSSGMSGGRLSTFSARSSNSTTTSPTKRGVGSRSSQSSPQKPGTKLKKEFPLVLLHCSLLSPSMGLRMGVPESWWLKEALPEEYWNRWKTLEEKVLGNVEVRTRGILIPHPKADYDLLEERLLECLELQRPRVRNGHFLGAQSEEMEGDDDESEPESTQCSQCPDCGRRVATGLEMERRWEIKVYAANGLMRAGAWGAAWGEMEKVDVEVGVWMPAEVRREVEARLHDIGYTGVDEDSTVHGDIEESEEERRTREIYGNHTPDAQEKIDGFYDEEHHGAPPQAEGQRSHSANTQHAPAADLPSLILKYLKRMTPDRRNVVIAFLSVLVLFYAMTTPILNTASPGNPSPSLKQEVVTTTITTTAIHSIQSECASATSTSCLQSISALGNPATDSRPVTDTASNQSTSANESTSTMAAAPTQTSEESQPVVQQTVATVLADEVPAATAE